MKKVSIMEKKKAGNFSDFFFPIVIWLYDITEFFFSFSFFSMNHSFQLSKKSFDKEELE